jgi:hypothetical protein
MLEKPTDYVFPEVLVGNIYSLMLLLVTAGGNTNTGIILKVLLYKI